MIDTIRTKFTPHKRYHCNSGSEFQNVYQEQISKKDGKKYLVKTGETNVYEKIQADLEQSKVENIVHKLAMGDLSVLKQAQLTYVDATEMPKSLMEAQNIVIRAKQEFDKFPADVRKQFNNSPEQYVSEMGTDEFIKKMSPFNDEIRKKHEKDNTEKFNKAVKEQAEFNKAVNKAMEGGNEE